MIIFLIRSAGDDALAKEMFSRLPIFWRKALKRQGVTPDLFRHAVEENLSEKTMFYSILDCDEVEQENGAITLEPYEYGDPELEDYDEDDDDIEFAYFFSIFQARRLAVEMRILARIKEDLPITTNWRKRLPRQIVQNLDFWQSSETREAIAASEQALKCLASQDTDHFEVRNALVAFKEATVAVRAALEKRKHNEEQSQQGMAKREKLDVVST